MSGWFYIILSSFCAVIVAHILKVSEKRQLNTLRVLAVNYLFCTLTSILLLDFTTLKSIPDISLSLVLLSLLTGVLFVVNYFTFSKSVHYNGVGITVSAMRLSLVIPVLLSVFWYGEEMHVRQWAGVALTILVLYLLLPTGKNGKSVKGGVYSLIILLFLLTGAGDSLLKVYQEEMSHLTEEPLFLTLLFSASLLSCVIFLGYRQVRGTGRIEVMTGILLGIPNLLTVHFLLQALSLLDGGIVYTSVNLLIVLGGTSLGFWWWSEKIERWQWVGILLTLIAVVLLAG